MGEKVKLAFQGGGARLASVIAAAEAIQELIEEEIIEVVATAGTSAGAFGAVLSAIPQAEISEVRKKLLEIDNNEILKALPTIEDKGEIYEKIYKGWAFYKIVRGHSLVSMNPLRELVKKALKPLGIDPNSTFKSLEIENTRIVAANVKTGEKEIYSGDSKVIEALLDSAALPIIYRMHNAPGNSLILDGGLFANLPVDELEEGGSGENEVPIVGLSFEEAAYEEDAESTLVYFKQILNAMIDQQVRAVKLKLDKNVCLIKTDLKTFDTHLFQDALEVGPYEKSKKSVRKFFLGENSSDPEGWIYQQKLRRIERGSKDRRNDGDRLKDFSSELTRYLDRQIESLSEIDVDQFRMVVIAHSLLVKKERSESGKTDDRVDMIFKFSTSEKTVSCLRTQLMKSSQGGVSDVDWDVQNARGTKLNYFCFPIYDENGVHSHYVLFDPPLGAPETGQGPYQVTYTQFIDEAVKDLRSGNSDVFAQSCKTFRSFKEVDLVLYAPKDLSLEFVSILDTRKLEEELDFPQNSVDLELVEGSLQTGRGERFERFFASYTWNAKNVKKGQGVAVKFING